MTNKDWSGNGKSIYVTLGASSHTDKDREEDDYYATDPIVAKLLLEEEMFNYNIWECACGVGDLSKVFVDAEYNVKSTDLVYRGYGEGNVDFLSGDNTFFDGDIITNPPYKYAKEFILKALDIIPTGNKVAMFLKVQFLEGKDRKKMFLQYPPKTIYVSSGRILCAKNGEFEKMRAVGGSAVAYGQLVITISDIMKRD